ncbi:MAG: hypothetical protein N2450_02500 [bacterium]|nr:hypothetical protein [bacterium]
MKTTTISGKLVVRALELNGYVQKKVKGNHILMTGYKGGNYLVIQANGEIPSFHLMNVLSMSGIPRKVFFQSLAKVKSKMERSESLFTTIFSKKNKEQVPEKKRPKSLN